MKYDINSINDKALPPSLNNFLNYLDTIRGKSVNTIAGYKLDLTMFFRFLKMYKGYTDKKTDFEEIKINDIDKDFLNSITLPDIYAFISFVENYRDNKSYARARKIAAIRSFFKYLHTKEKILKENPAQDLETPKIDKRNPIYLTLKESKNLLSSIDGDNKERDYCIITLFLNCGLRLSELVSIDIPRIKGDILTVVGKGNKERTIYLNPASINSINDYLIIRNEFRDKIKEDKDALFISRNLKRINKRTVELIVKKWISIAGIENEKMSPHKLRHTAATLMYKYGNVDIRSLQQILGHENVSTTQIYTHVDSEKLREAVNLNPLSHEKKK